MEAKDVTAIFFFEEAIRAVSNDPKKIRKIIQTAKRSQGYLTSKALQERVLEQEKMLVQLNSHHQL